MPVRGYAKWQPKEEARYWVSRAQVVLDEYETFWPLSVRQVFYRLVADHGYEKSEAAYGRLTQLLGRARRAGLVPWKAIRDGGLGRSIPASFYDSEKDFLESIQDAAAYMRLDRQKGQKVVIELWCEAGGMVPILQDIAAPYGCRVNTGGGYDSVTAKHQLATRVRTRAASGRGTLILHVGDFDGSGEDMCAVLREDAEAMVASQIGMAVLNGQFDALRVPQRARPTPGVGYDKSSARAMVAYSLSLFRVERVALTGEQVIERGVETAPPKRSDSRTAEFRRRNAWVAEELGTPHITAQLEALTPPELEELIASAIRDRLDMDAYESVLLEERVVRDSLLERLDDLLG